MVAASITWDFATDLTPSAASGGLAGSWGPMGSTPANWDSSGAYSWRFVDLGTVRLMVGPAAGTQWTPGSIIFKMRRSAGTSDGFFSLGGDYTIEWSGALTTAYRTVTIDLSSLGTVDGPIDLRFWSGGTSTQRAYLDDVTVSGNVLTGSDQTISPAGIASAEAIGPAAVVVVQPVNLSPEAIVSGEAFGTPSVVVVPLVEILGAGGIASGEVVGGPDVRPATPGSVRYPTGADVADFMDAPALVALATVHVGVITQFARVYTRDNGFYVDGVAEPIAGVILAATARLVGNPEQIDVTVGSVRRASYFKGWSLAEQRVLNNYRKVAQ